MAAIVARVSSANVRLLTLTGPGGVGKTRLALKVAETLEAYADGVFFVVLAPISDPDLVVLTVAQALGIPDAGGNLRDSVRDFLSDKQLLLVLDNFEHLLPAAPVIAELLAEAPDLNVLVTSREVLRLSGEHTLEVPPLRLPSRTPLPPPEGLSQYDAVRLFIERAQAVKPDFQVTDANARTVSEICHRLDGLPLAVELAAARVRHLPPEDLLLRLERRLSVLTAGPRDLPARHRTLRDAIAWSYDLLSPGERALFRRQAVFVGGCMIQDIEAVCGEDSSDTSTDVLDRLASLIDKSLVRQEPGAAGPRYTMLETLREYGLEQLAASGEESKVRERYVEYFETLVREAVPHFLVTEQLWWLARMDDALDNVRVVLQWLVDQNQRERGQLMAGSLWYFWSIHNRVSEGREALTRLLAGPDGQATSPRTRGLAQMALGLTLAKQFDVVACEAAFAESLILAQQAGDARTTAIALTRSAWITSQLADWRSSRSDRARHAAHDSPHQPKEKFEQALAIARREGDAWAAACCLMEYAQFLSFSDDVRARHVAREALQVARALGDRYTTAGSLRQLAHVVDEPVETRRLLNQSLALSRELGDVFNESLTLGGIAQLDMDVEQFADELCAREQRVQSFRLLRNRPQLASALHDLAIAAHMEGDADRAVQACEESLALFRDLGLEAQAAAVRASLGHARRQGGAAGAAAAMFGESLRVLSRLGIEFGMATAFAGLGLLAFDAGRQADGVLAAALFEKVLAAFSEDEGRRPSQGKSHTATPPLAALVAALRVPTAPRSPGGAGMVATQP
jgi:predicted ATPase